MTRWQNQLHNAITDSGQLAEHFSINEEQVQQVQQHYPMRITPYFLELIKSTGAGLYKQAIPDILELQDPDGFIDPLDEENLSPVPNLVHRYPDRALFLVHNQCAMYCRFCTRKRKVGTRAMAITDASIQAGLDYLRSTPAITDVLLSGGDPLLLSDQRLDKILHALRAIPSISTIRIGSRTPCTLPMRITTGLTRILKKYHPLYINTHFNHPAEITTAAASACTRLANAGIPLGCQTVLLKGVNDSPKIIQELMHNLLKIRVKPYYLFQTDQTKGTAHFRTTIETGIDIMKHLIGHTSGMAIPTFALDAPGGAGKIPLTPDYVTHLGSTLEFNSYKNIPCTYPNTCPF